MGIHIKPKVQFSTLTIPLWFYVPHHTVEINV